jgi:hypothetical protein
MSEAFLLSPYKPPTSYPVSLSADESGAWLAGYFALWHPAVLLRLDRPPQSASSYDHDQPAEGFIYAVPSGPHLYQPEDWPHRVKEANAYSFAASADLQATRAALREALALEDTISEALLRAFAGVGYAYLVIESLFDAADHDHLLDAQGFWSDVQQAAQQCQAGVSEEVLPLLKNACEKLRAAREVLNSSNFYLLDWVILDADKLQARWPGSLAAGLPLNLLASGELLERLATEQPERFAELQAKILPDLPSNVDLITAAVREREETLLPIESQHWNFHASRSTIKKLFATETLIAGRKRSAYHPLQPGWLQHHGFKKAVMLSLDGATTPNRNACVINWPGQDGQAIEAFGREPLPASDPSTFFNLVYTLHQATTSDSKPTVGFVHRGDAPAIGYDELIAFAELSDALGSFTGLSRYFEEYHYGEYIGNAGVDDFFTDDLDDRVTNRHRPDAVSGFAQHQRDRRRLDTAFTLAAVHRMLTPSTADEQQELQQLSDLEHDLELQGPDHGPINELEPRLKSLEQRAAKRLADRLQLRAAENQPGVLLFNPCVYTRRAAVELAHFPGPIPINDPIKAAQFENGTAKLVVEMPPLGFVWLPRTPSGSAPKPKMKLAEGNTVRNEFFEADIDPVTGGLRSFRDLRNRLNRLGMQLVFNPGSKSVAKSVQVTSSGAALGEITAQGELLDDHNQLLAKFTHRLRAWAGRPALEMLLEIEPIHAPTGYPWHAFFGARFGWRDERSALFRGVNSLNALTTSTRPVSPDYLEIRLGGERTFIFTGGLPFWQKNGTRMADAILIPEGETCKRFEFLIAADREYPMQTAQGWVTPTPVVYTEKGPPNGMASSWLGHLDLPSLLLTDLRPQGEARTLTARFIECSGFGGAADLRFAVPVQQAKTIDGIGELLREITVIDGAVPLEFSAQETFRLNLDFTPPNP